jgi:hypothetical protein
MSSKQVKDAVSSIIPAPSGAGLVSSDQAPASSVETDVEDNNPQLSSVDVALQQLVSAPCLIASFLPRALHFCVLPRKSTSSLLCAPLHIDLQKEKLCLQSQKAKKSLFNALDVAKRRIGRRQARLFCKG